MPAPAKYIINGTGPVLRDWDFRESVSGPDEVRFLAQDCAARNTYAKGSQVPGYTAMRIVDTNSKLVPGALWNISCNARGLISGNSRVIKRSESTDPFGFDVLNEVRFELKSEAVPAFGAVHPEFANLRFLSAGTEESLDIGDGTSSWVNRPRTYKGIIGDGTDKLIQRKITNNGNIVSSDSLIVDLTGGWTDPRKSEVSLPRIVVSDTVISLTAPNTLALPGNATPPGAPTVLLLTPAGPDVRHNWPNGWRVSGVGGTELYYGAGIWSNTIDYEYVWPVTL